MAVKIGHASGTEYGGATGGQAGDQTGKELCIRDWYTKGWHFLARPKDAKVAEQIAKSCEAGCANDNIGYDQGERNTLLARAQAVNWDLSKITAKCECDCSSFVSCCVTSAGVPVWKTGQNAPTTRTLRSVLRNTGAFDIITDSSYLNSSSKLKRGDILCKEGSHTVMVLTNGGSSDSYTPPVSTNGNNIRSSTTYTLRLPLLQQGDSGPIVKSLQELLILHEAYHGVIDGKFDADVKNGVIWFQNHKGLETDGKVGGQTWSALLGI